MNKPRESRLRRFGTPVKPRFWAIIYVSMERLWADEAVSLSGNIAFRTLFSAFPFLIFLTALGAYFGDEDLANGLIQFMSRSLSFDACTSRTSVSICCNRQMFSGSNATCSSRTG